MKMKNATANVDATELSVLSSNLEEGFSNSLTDETGKFDMLDIFDDCYGILKSNTYRLKYPELLSIDFQRVPAPINSQFFKQVVRLGAYLRKLHLLTDPVPNDLNIEFIRDGDRIISGVHFSDDKVYINRTQYFSNVR
ncbi:MAG: type ISP restriction/modification enzyme [Cloacibacillus sp.]